MRVPRRGRHGGAVAELWLYLLLRALTGACEAVQNTVLLLYAVDEFEPQGAMGTVMGWSESCAGVGIIVGPVISLLARHPERPVSFSIPFILLGFIFVALIPVLVTALRHVAPPVRSAEARPSPPWRAYLRYDIVNAAVGTFAMGLSFGVIIPTLSPHLEVRLGVRRNLVGLVYMIPALVYGVACPLAGIAADKYGHRRLMLRGFTLVGLAFVMMGPVPLLRPLLPQLWVAGHPLAWAWAVSAMVLFGVGGACGFVPTMPAALRGAEPLGPAGKDMVASAYWTVYYAGEGLGPGFGTFFVGTQSPEQIAAGDRDPSALGAGWGYCFVAFLLFAYVLISADYARSAPPELLGAEAGPAVLELAREDPLPHRAEGEDTGSDESETAGLLGDFETATSPTRRALVAARDKKAAGEAAAVAAGV